MNVPEPDRFVSIREAMTLTSLSRTSVYRLRRRGDFPPARRLGVDRLAFSFVELRAWMDSRTGVRPGVAAVASGVAE